MCCLSLINDIKRRNSSGGAPVLPFLAVIMIQLGLPGHAVGSVLAFKQVILLGMRPVIGMIMDK